MCNKLLIFRYKTENVVKNRVGQYNRKTYVVCDAMYFEEGNGLKQSDRKERKKERYEKTISI